ncbi:IS66 family transposase [Sphaerisporangium aureirubrum]|uniref:Transposase n=1 Tax=Sphaerisporangium aureirubrum TaxID=1544736 RepID=A0ABW1NWL4_9ACTN
MPRPTDDRATIDHDHEQIVLGVDTHADAQGTQAMWIESFRHGVRLGLSKIPRIPRPAKTVTQPIGRVLLEVLRDRETDVLRFAHDLGIPPTNNQAERDVRPAKTQ